MKKFKRNIEEIINIAHEEELKFIMNQEFESFKRKRVFKRWFVLLSGIVSLAAIVSSLFVFNGGTSVSEKVLKKENKILVSQNMKTYNEKNSAESILKVDSTYESYKSIEIPNKRRQEVKKDSLIELVIPPNVEEKEVNSPSSVIEKKDSVDCDKVEITFTSESGPSCNNENNGYVKLLDIRGGQKPYLINWEGEKGDRTNIVDLPSGSYSVFVEDQNGCLSKEKVVEIEKKTCLKKEYAFNLGFVDFRLPTELNVKSISIYNRKNRLVFKKNVAIWDGKDNFDVPVEIGLYLCIVEFEDDQPHKCYITID